jgi:hypothetical protein
MLGGYGSLYFIFKFKVEYSAKMEPFATKMILARLLKKRIGIRVLTTDRSSQLKRLMRDINVALKRRGRHTIKHSYDVWHMVKAVTKDLFVASKLKQCQTLGSWITSVRNMLWHCFSTCQVPVIYYCLFCSVAYPGCLSRIQPLFSSRIRILDYK